jgi:hypothetical protein
MRYSCTHNHLPYIDATVSERMEDTILAEVDNVIETRVEHRLEAMMDELRETVANHAIGLISHANDLRNELDSAFHDKTQNLDKACVATIDAIDDYTEKALDDITTVKGVWGESG